MSVATASSYSDFKPEAHPYRWMILFGVWLLYSGFGLTIAAIAPLVVPITTELGISHSAMGSVMGAWPLIYIGSAIPCGAFIDRAGPRAGLLAGAVIMAASGFLRGAAEGHLLLFFAVALFGFGGPLISIGAPKLIALWFEGKERGLAMGVYITGPSLGGVAALSLTNSVMMPWTEDDWRLVLMIYGGAVLAAGAVWWVINLHPASREVEKRLKEEPKRPQLEIFRSLIGLRPVQIVLVMSVLIFFFNHGLNNWLPEILRHGGMDAVTAGYWASIPTIIGVLAALIIPRLATPSRRLLIVAGLFLAAGAASLLLLLSGGPGLALGLALQGIARSSMMTIALLILVEVKEVGPKNAGAAGGMFFSAAEIGGVSGPLMLGIIYDATGGFDLGLNLMTGMCATLLLLLLALKPYLSVEKTTAKES